MYLFQNFLMVWSNSEQKSTVLLLISFLKYVPLTSLSLSYTDIFAAHGTIRVTPLFPSGFCSNTSVMGSPITSFKTETASPVLYPPSLFYLSPYQFSVLIQKFSKFCTLMM